MRKLLIPCLLIAFFAACTKDRVFTDPTGTTTGTTGVTPVDPSLVAKVFHKGDLVINEYNSKKSFMSSDWFEIYNKTDSIIAFDSAYWMIRSKDGDYPIRKPFSIQPKGFLVILCDLKGKDSSGYIHANFDLGSSAGKMAIIYTNKNKVVTIIDEVDYPTAKLPVQADNTSFGLYPDGNQAHWVLADSMINTPGTANRVK